MNPDLVKRYAAPAPRYTSYPTAAQFTPAVGAGQYADWLSDLAPGANLSLYCHVPFCQSLCWYCGCNTKATRRYDPVADYLDVLVDEIATVAARLPRSHTVSHIHWGGGTPNILEPAGIARLAGALRRNFSVAADAEFAVEIDPRYLEPCQVTAFAVAGVNRVSVGVQDFDEAVQSAIARHQTFEMTERTVGLFRDQGIGSINVDLVYGLPHQTQASVERTIRQVLSLNPDRIAIFGYAHLPSRLVHQRLIDERALPGPTERLAQSALLADILASEGFVRIGLDHFARPTDTLATKTLRRNFQGYSTETADALIGLGASSIGQLPDGYVQNATSTGEYMARVKGGRLATARGVPLSSDDKARAFVIERLMCAFSFSANELAERFGGDAATVLADAERAVDEHEAGFLVRTGDGYAIPEAGRPFVRTICASFDRYFEPAAARHAMAV